MASRDDKKPFKVELDTRALLTVEGWSDRDLLYRLLEHLGIKKGIQIYAHAEEKPLGEVVETLAKLSGFCNLQTFALVLDAEANAQAIFQRAKEALKRIDLGVPSAIGELTNGNPRTGVFLMPGGDRPGMLETLLHEAVKDDPAWGCIDSFVECTGRLAVPPKNRLKAQIQAFLASRSEAGLNIGSAAEAKYFNFDSQAYDPLKAFLRQV